MIKKNIFEKIYYIGYSIKKKYTLKFQRKLPYPVVSIGNITVGGTGKTPLTISLSEEAKKRGFVPIILTRGYKGKARGPCFVKDIDQSSLLSDESTNKSEELFIKGQAARLYGDEPVLMAEALKDVPIVKCANRYKGGIFVINELNLKSPNSGLRPIFILDDGFQHWKLYRDLDIVLIDFTNPFGNYKLLPLGILREPLKELKRANVILITKIFKSNKASDENLEAIVNKINSINPSALIYFSSYKIVGLYDTVGNKIPIKTIKDKRIFAFCAIGSPEYFFHILSSITNYPISTKKYRDHHQYTEKDILYLSKLCKMKECDFLVTTQKDIVKLKDLNLPENILYIRIDFDIEKDFFDNVFKIIEKSYHHGG
jgi:tetraacyldisaccharide 4'-kinase